MEYDVYHIPANFTDAGRLFGLFETRNAIEAVAICIPTIFLCIKLLHFSLMINTIIILSIVVPVGGLTMLGIQDVSLTKYIATWWRWRRRRICLTYRGEVRATNGTKRNHFRRKS